MKRSWVCGVVAAVVGWVAPAMAQQQQATRPNFLFVYTDDQRWDAMGCVQREQGEAARFPWFRTPNMDRLAAEGVRFRNAFVVNSLCAPSRACFLSGQYNHENGVVNNHMEFPLGDVTSSALLAKAGYRTAYFGKWHHKMQKERPGFQYVASFLGQGEYYDCPFNVNGVMTPTRGRVDDVSTDYLIAYLKDHVAHHNGEPFDVVLGYKAPHDPRTPAEEDRGLYAGESVRPAPNALPLAPFLPKDQAARIKSQQVGDERLNYFRSITSADRSFGRLLDALDHLGLADDTVVIFTTDNGYYMGEHGLNDKRSAYEESMRIPLILRWPKGVAKGKTEDAMVTNVDLAPTLLDLAGVPVPKEMQGRSWRPLLSAPATFRDWRHAFFYEYFFETYYGNPTTLAVRTDDAKLIKYPGHDEWTELFDLQHDSGETHNLYNDPAAKDLRARMEAEFDKQAKAVDFRIPDNADKPKANEEGHF
jgi:arylsulfatase A-like enzyme